MTGCGAGGTKTISNIPSELVQTGERPEPPRGQFNQAEFGEYSVAVDTKLIQCNNDKKAIKSFIDRVKNR